MSDLRANITEAHYRINSFLGVNEAPDGDTKLKEGEAAVMRNWRVTDSGSLKRRPGTRQCIGLSGNGYQVKEGAAEVIYSEMNVSTKEITVYQTAAADASGHITLGGTTATASFSDVQGGSYRDWYFMDGGAVYRLKKAELSGHQGIGGAIDVDGGWAWESSTSWGNSSSYSVPQRFLHDDALDKIYPFFSGVTIRNGAMHLTGKDTSTVLADLRESVSANSPIYRTNTTWNHLYTDAKNIGYETNGVGSIVYEITSVVRTLVRDDYNSEEQAYNYHYYYTFSGRRLRYAADKTYLWYAAPVFADATVSTDEIKALWSGWVNQSEYLIAACGGNLWRLTESGGTWSRTSLGSINTNGVVTLFGMSDKLYILDGTGYYVWDGTTLANVYGYAPLVVTAAEPGTGSGQTLERVNLLTRQRRKRFSSDGATIYYHLESDLDSVDRVVVNGVEDHNYSALLISGNVGFPQGSPPPAGSNNVEITYTVSLTQRYRYTGNGVTTVFEIPVDAEEIDEFVSATVGGTSALCTVSGNRITFASAPAADASVVITMKLKDPRDKILAMRYAEFFNGQNDNRVFLYGDGSNTTYYSGIDEYGKGRADYFPDLNEIEVGDNSPITAMCRHYSRLLIFKSQSAYSVYYDIITLADGSATDGFYLSSVNRVVGCDAMGQAQLVENKVRTPDGQSIYEWAATYSGGVITNDQRNAKRISQRVEKTLGEFDLTQCVTWFDKIRHEYWCVYDGTAVVHNTELDAWSVYTNIPATAFVLWQDEVYFGAADSWLRHMSEDYACDDDTGGVPSVNLLPTVYWFEKASGSTRTQYGQTFTLNDDGSVTVTGTATANNTCYLTGHSLTSLVRPIELDPRKTYTLSGCPAGGSASSYELYVRGTPEGETPSSSSGKIYRDTGSGVTFTGVKYATVGIYHRNGTAGGGRTFYPMLVEGAEVHEYQSSHNGNRAIPCYWESGSLDFNRPWVRKYSAELWMILQQAQDKSVRAGFWDDENHDGVKTLYTAAPGLAITRRARLKSRNMSHYKLTIESGEETPATVEGAVIAVKYAANIKRGPDI